MFLRFRQYIKLIATDIRVSWSTELRDVSTLKRFAKVAAIAAPFAAWASLSDQNQQRVLKRISWSLPNGDKNRLLSTVNGRVITTPQLLDYMPFTFYSNVTVVQPTPHPVISFLRDSVSAELAEALTPSIEKTLASRNVPPCLVEISSQHLLDYLRAQPSASANAIVACFELSSSSQPQELLGEIERVLIPQGRFFFIDKTLYSTDNWRRSLQEFCLRLRPSDYRKPVDVKALLRDPNFSMIYLETWEAGFTTVTNESGQEVHKPPTCLMRWSNHQLEEESDGMDRVSSYVAGVAIKRQ